MSTRDRVFRFIVDYKQKCQGNTPTMDEIAKGCGLAHAGHAKFHLGHLERTGRITRTGRNIYIPGAEWILNNRITEEAENE